MYEVGLSQFYAQYAVDGVLRDYPPGYMYFLWLMGALSYRFGWNRLDTIFNFVSFLPAILADLGIGYIIYRMAAYGRLTKPPKDKGDEEEKPKDLPIATTVRALKISALWILNPAVILISSVWGQVESVFTIFLLVSLILIREKKIIASYLIYAVAILIKAQSLFLAPVYLFTAIVYIRDSRISSNLDGYKASYKATERLVIAILASVLLMILLALPFSQGINIMPIVRQYTGGLGTYPWVSINAFNFWGLVTNVGHSWSPLSTVHVVSGIIIVIALIAGSMYVLFRDHYRHDGKHFYFIVAALLSLIFIFSVRMHERYLFPAFTFFLLYYAQTREKRGIGLYIATSITFFVNCFEVLRWLEAGAHGSGVMETSGPIFSFANFVIGCVIIFMFIQTRWMERTTIVAATKAKQSNKDAAIETKRSKSNYSKPTPPEPEIIDPPPMKIKDYAFIFAVIIIYSAIAFFRLGDMQAPQTSWTPELGEAVTIDLGSTQTISEIVYRMGPVHDRAFSLEASDDGENWRHIQMFSPGFTAVFHWNYDPIVNEDFVLMPFDARYLQIRSQSEGLRIQEVAFRNPHGELIPIASVYPANSPLVDEQHLVPEHRYFMNSTYFDEVYHARAGYEFLHRLNVFETTHPNMGQNFKAMSIAVFGMTPFGWRFPGTMAGVLMVPLIYAFARLLFKSNNWGLFATILFTFDFMHFAQTRIATIDSYVTLFVIAMYFFMYRFIHGVERDSFRKKMIILLLCGISVGLAIASKWQGVYAVLGLPFVFFPALYRLYLRDRKQAETIFYSCFGFFVAIPLVIYLLSYIPFVNATGGGGLRNIWANTVSMYRYHSGLVETHSFSSYWWEWPLVLRPIWLYAGRIVDGARGTIASFGNPAVWWAGFVASIYIIFHFFTQLTPVEFVQFLKKPAYLRKRGLFITKGLNRDIAFLLVAFAAQYLPWMLISRLTWIYHFFPSVPFVVLILTWVVKHMVERQPKLKGVAIAYACIVVALFALFYPVLSAWPISMEFVQTYLHWLPRWHF